MPRLLLLLHAVLFLCVSLRLGLGVASIIMVNDHTVQQEMTLPLAALQPTLQWLGTLIVFGSLLLLITEWFSGVRMAAVGLVLAVLGSAVIHWHVMLPIETQVQGGLLPREALGYALLDWVSGRRWQVAFWMLQWWCLMAYFAVLSWSARQDR